MKRQSTTEEEVKLTGFVPKLEYKDSTMMPTLKRERERERESDGADI